MNVKVIKVMARCGTFELDCKTCFYAEHAFKVFLDGEFYGEYKNNCFALYNLKPSKQYELVIYSQDEKVAITFETIAESALLDITLFGARGDGITDCTLALQAAVSCCPKGGTVYVPEGVYLTYPIFMKSDITLYLAKDAVLLGGVERHRYPILPGMIEDEELKDSLNLGSWEGNPLDSYAALITAVGVKKLNICGEGEINGNADASDWWENEKVRRGAWRPKTIFLNRCNHVTLLGITVKNSPCWTIHPYYCDNVDILNIMVKNPDNSPNTDGIDPESCENVQITGTVISVGDDCIALKSGKYYMGKFHPKQTKNVVIRNCLLERGHGAVVIGSEISAGVTNVCIEQCLIKNTDRGLRVKTRRGRGNTSIVDHVIYRNVRMEKVLTPFVINMHYFCDPDGRSEYVSSKEALPVDEMTPQIGKLLLQDVTCIDAEYAAMFFYGLKEQPIESVELHNVSVSFLEGATQGMPAMMEGIDPMSKVGLFATNVRQVVLENVKITGQDGEKLILENVPIIEEV